MRRKRVIGRKLAIFVFLASSLLAQTLIIESFESDLFSKRTHFEVRKVSVDLRVMEWILILFYP